MPSRIAVVAIAAVQPRLIAGFWCSVLGWQVVEEDAEVISIAPSGGAWPTIDVLTVPERKTVQNRLHLDLRADGVATSQELDRLLSLRARGVSTSASNLMSAGSFSATQRATSSVCSHGRFSRSSRASNRVRERSSRGRESRSWRTVVRTGIGTRFVHVSRADEEPLGRVTAYAEVGDGSREEADGSLENEPIFMAQGRSARSHRRSAGRK